MRGEAIAVTHPGFLVSFHVTGGIPDTLGGSLPRSWSETSTPPPATFTMAQRRAALGRTALRDARRSHKRAQARQEK